MEKYEPHQRPLNGLSKGLLRLQGFRMYTEVEGATGDSLPGLRGWEEVTRRRTLKQLLKMKLRVQRRH